MKRIAILIPAVAVGMMLHAASARTDEGTMYGGQREAAGSKNECLLVAKNCVDNVDSIQQRMGKLQHEIAKGRAVYTNDELRILNQKLDDAKRLFIEMESNP